MADSKRIVLTGVSKGLGRAILEVFHKEGHVVAGCARSQAAIDQLHAEFPPPHRFDVVDVTDDHAVAAWAKNVLADGPVDLLLNNAALINHNNLLWEVPPEEFSQVVDVNIKGVFHVLRHFVPAMIERGSGVIVNFSSAWGRAASPEVGPYCTTKFAIEGLTKALAKELPRGLTAVPLNPGVINTEMLQSCFGKHASAYPDAKDWARRAAPFVLQLRRKDNGESLSVP